MPPTTSVTDKPPGSPTAVRGDQGEPDLRDATADLPAAIMVQLRQMLAAHEGLGGQWRRALGISPNERLALVHLHETGQLTISELGALIPLSRPAMTSLVDNLEKAGYVRRHPDSSDRRRIVVELSERPFVLVAPVFVPFTSELRARLANFSAADLRTILAFTTMMDEVLRRHTARLRAISDEELLRLVGDGVIPD